MTEVVLFLAELVVYSTSATFWRPQTTQLCSVLIYNSLWACARVKMNRSSNRIKAQPLTDLIAQLHEHNQDFSSGIQTNSPVMLMRLSQTEATKSDSHLPLCHFGLNTFPLLLQVAQVQFGGAVLTLRGHGQNLLPSVKKLLVYFLLGFQCTAELLQTHRETSCSLTT